MAKKTGQPEQDRPGTNETVPDNVDVDQAQVDDFSDLFEGGEGELFRVELIRLEPETYKNVRMRGYLCDLQPGTTYDDIKKQYGGGRYRADKRDAKTGRYSIRRQFEISPWIPKMEEDGDKSADRAENLVDQPKIDVAGVSVPIGQVEHIKELVLWMRAIRVLLPEPESANTQLLGTLVELVKEKSTPADDPLELLTKLRAAVPEIFEKSGDAGNLYTLLQEAIRQAGPILAGGYRPPGKRKLLKEKPLPTGGIGPGAPETKEGDETMPSTDSDTDLMVLLGELIKAFRLDPPKEPKRVVAMFDHIFPHVTKEQRVEMRAVREVGLDVAENQLAEDFAEDASLRDKFSAYYTEVFDLYTDPERKTA